MPAAPSNLRDDWRELPHPHRLGHDHPQWFEILRRHSTAAGQGLPVYADPTTGLSVFTSTFLADRGYCCESGCRHCPYLGGAVPDALR